MVIRELSFHTGEGAAGISDCCACAPKPEANETNVTMEANALRRISFSRASRMTLPPASILRRPPAGSDPAQWHMRFTSAFRCGEKQERHGLTGKPSVLRTIRVADNTAANPSGYKKAGSGAATLTIPALPTQPPSPPTIPLRPT